MNIRKKTITRRIKRNKKKITPRIRIADLNIPIRSPCELALIAIYKEARDAFDEDFKTYNK